MRKSLSLSPQSVRLTPPFVRSILGAMQEVHEFALSSPCSLVTKGAAKFYWWVFFGPVSSHISYGLNIDGMGDTEYASELLRLVNQLFIALFAMPCPTVAMVTGHGFGAGFMLALAHDYRTMKQDKVRLVRCLMTSDTCRAISASMRLI